MELGEFTLFFRRLPLYFACSVMRFSSLNLALSSMPSTQQLSIFLVLRTCSAKPYRFLVTPSNRVLLLLVLVKLATKAKHFIPGLTKTNMVVHYMLKLTTHALNCDEMVPDLGVTS